MVRVTDVAALPAAIVYGETYIAYAVRRWIHKVETVEPNPRAVFVIGWGGMRGVLSLAAAVSLPYALPNRRTFPQRSMIIYLAFCLIVTTLVFQGLTLPWLIRKLDLSKSGRMHDEEQEARRILLGPQHAEDSNGKHTSQESIAACGCYPGA
jgi:monovalent cation/hydrogen antiporter